VGIRASLIKKLSGGRCHKESVPILVTAPEWNFNRAHGVAGDTRKYGKRRRTKQYQTLSQSSVIQLPEFISSASS
jgi:hypothetical protein